MISGGNYALGASVPLSEGAVLASLFMSQDDNNTESDSKGSMKDDWGGGSGASDTFLTPDDFDIYVNKITGDTYIFHGPDLPHDVERLEYDPEDHSVTVVTKNGMNLDLGVKIQWLIRPYFSKAKKIFIVKTKDGESVDGIEVPLVIKGAKD